MEKKDKSIEYSSYIRQFWVGLMDGLGSLQVNHWRKKSLQYRLVIKLKNDPDKYNYILLQRIAKSIGGNVIILSSSRSVIWVENHKSKISQIVKIFDKYPPYTKRLYDQYLFYLESVKINTVDWYLENRDKKYIIKQYRSPSPSVRQITTLKTKRWPINLQSSSVINLGKIENQVLWYNSIPDGKKHTEEQSFKGWLSGFIEAEGCFTLRSGCSSKTPFCSFSISQKGDFFLLERINMFFGGQRRVRKVQKKQKHIYIDQKKDQKDGLYILEIYRKTVLEKVLLHCTAYPLYGEKQKQIIFLKKHLYKCRVVLPLWK